MLFTRSVIYKLTVIIVGMALIESVIFLFLMRSALFANASGVSMLGVESFFDSSAIPWVFVVAFLLSVFLLSYTGGDYTSKLSYTLKRLSVSEKAVFAIHALCNSVCLFLLWFAQTALVYLFCKLYIRFAPSDITSVQSLLLAFYRSSFAHSLLPLAEVSRWVRNFIMVIGLGMACAYTSYKQRKSAKPSLIIAFLAGFALPMFAKKTGMLSSDIFMCLANLWAVAYIAVSINKKEQENEA